LSQKRQPGGCRYRYYCNNYTAFFSDPKPGPGNPKDWPQSLM